MPKILLIERKQYSGKIYDVTLQNTKNPYFYANGVLSHNSAYPHAMMMFNLYGRQKTQDSRPTYSGRWKVKGCYYTDEMTQVGKLIIKWYNDRDTLKKQGDRREYSLKIFINIVSGILKESFYEKTYDLIANDDCTRIGRQWLQFGNTKFREAGYDIFYNATDSFYIIDPFRDKERLLKVKQSIIDEIKATVPFPQETFDLELEAQLKYVYFFKGKNKENIKLDDDFSYMPIDLINQHKGLMKANYIYVTKDNKLVVKNLGIKDKSTSALTKKIFWDYFSQDIIHKGIVKFSKSYIEQLIDKLLKEDISLIQLRKKVYTKEVYKNKTSVQYQLSDKYGEGIHFVIPITKSWGVGKKKKYCTLEEFKLHNLTIKDIDLSNVWAELNYFIAPVVTKNIFDYARN